MQITEDQNDVFCEIMNIGVGDAAALLNEMVNCHVSLTAPSITLVDKESLYEKLSETLGEEISVVEMGFEGGMEGMANLLFSVDSGKKLVDILSDETDDEDYNTLKAGTLTEVGNIILNSVLASFSNSIDSLLDYSVPSFSELDVKKFVSEEVFEKSRDESSVFLCEVNFSAKEIKVFGRVLLVLNPGSISKVFEKFDVAS